MSRIGRAPVLVEKGVQVTVTPENEVVVKGTKFTEKVKMRPEITAKIEDGKILLSRKNEENPTKALHGLYRALLQNAVLGVTKGFSKTLVLNGVGYRAATKGKTLELTLGYSHPINYDIPEGIDVKVDKATTVVVSGANKGLVGQVSAKIRSFRPPEPYLGKGIKYETEVIRRKAGKTGGK